MRIQATDAKQAEAAIGERLRAMETNTASIVAQRDNIQSRVGTFKVASGVMLLDILGQAFSLSQHVKRRHPVVVTERQMQAKCDALIQKYKQVAEEATRRAKAEREEMQLEALERMKKEDADERKFEDALRDQTKTIVAAARKEAREAVE